MAPPRVSQSLSLTPREPLLPVFFLLWAFFPLPLPFDERLLLEELADERWKKLSAEETEDFTLYVRLSKGIAKSNRMNGITPRDRRRTRIPIGGPDAASDSESEMR